jgi:hypothetical protein
MTNNNDTIYPLTNLEKYKKDKGLLTDNEKLRIIESLIDYYPFLKKDRNVLNNIFFDQNDKINKFILDKVYVNKKPYYKSLDNLLIDVDIKCHGVYKDGNYYIIRSPNRKESYDKFIGEFKSYINEKFKS